VVHQVGSFYTILFEIHGQQNIKNPLLYVVYVNYHISQTIYAQ